MSLLAWQPKLSFTGKTNKNTKLISQQIHLAAILCPYLHRCTLSTIPRWSGCIHSTINLLAKRFKSSREHLFNWEQWTQVKSSMILPLLLPPEAACNSHATHTGEAQRMVERCTWIFFYLFIFFKKRYKRNN